MRRPRARQRRTVVSRRQTSLRRRRSARRSARASAAANDNAARLLKRWHLLGKRLSQRRPSPTARLRPRALQGQSASSAAPGDGIGHADDAARRHLRHDRQRSAGLQCHWGSDHARGHSDGRTARLVDAANAAQTTASPISGCGGKCAGLDERLLKLLQAAASSAAASVRTAAAAAQTNGQASTSGLIGSGQRVSSVTGAQTTSAATQAASASGRIATVAAQQALAAGQAAQASAPAKAMAAQTVSTAQQSATAGKPIFAAPAQIQQTGAINDNISLTGAFVDAVSLTGRYG